jgi:hypothetical protein
MVKFSHWARSLGLSETFGPAFGLLARHAEQCREDDLCCTVGTERNLEYMLV